MLGKISDMMGKLQELKQKMAEIKAKMDSTFVDVSGASGDIKNTINGNRKIQKLQIEPALQHGDKSALERQLTETLNKAIAEADKLNEAEMKKVAGGMIPPGLM